MDEERERGYGVCKETLRNRNQKDGGSDSDEESSEEEFGLSGVHKRMSSKQKEESSRRVNAHLQEAGGIFPLDQYETHGDGSGTECEIARYVSCRHGKQVKSGSEVKRRPVVKPLTWPHTIAYEDDGEEVSYENITLSTFLFCFTHIMTSCKKNSPEAVGRSNLLHAVNLVLKYLTWSDARTFHNLVMFKLEQGRYDWDVDFTVLANQYLETKVRQNLLKSRGVSSGGYSSRQNYRGAGRGSGSSLYNQDNGRRTSFICYQWNNGECSYGSNCRRWHCCLSCAKRGKLGEQHKASTHSNNNSSGSKGKTDQRP